jgi:hypothetical protein
MVEAIGWISFYGLTPSIDFFKHSKIDPVDDDKDINDLNALTSGMSLSPYAT